DRRPAAARTGSAATDRGAGRGSRPPAPASAWTAWTDPSAPRAPCGAFPPGSRCRRPACLRSRSGPPSLHFLRRSAGRSSLVLIISSSYGRIHLGFLVVLPRRLAREDGAAQRFFQELGLVQAVGALHALHGERHLALLVDRDLDPLLAHALLPLLHLELDGAVLLVLGLLQRVALLLAGHDDALAGVALVQLLDELGLGHRLR